MRIKTNPVTGKMYRQKQQEQMRKTWPPLPNVLDVYLQCEFNMRDFTLSYHRPYPAHFPPQKSKPKNLFSSKLYR